jgi:hypothetical protein
MTKLVYTSVALAAVLLGCGGGDTDDGAIDQSLLAQYRQAVPSQSQLMAPSPKASVSAKVGDPAMFPTGSQEIVLGINGAVVGIVETMRAIVETEPTVYNSATREFLWGPYPNKDGFGTVAAYIKDAGEGSDFRYHYALLRGTSNDVATMKPVIWGGATPDPENKDYGYGVTLWDFEANRAFEEANNPDFASLALDRGRFVAVYGKGADANGEAALVVSVFRGFVPKDKPQNAPGDLDYFYGRVTDSANTIDFVDWQSSFNVDDDPARPASEDVSVRMAFLNEGTGRAEAEASNGDLMASQKAAMVECWSPALVETYLSFTTSTNGVEDGSVTDGDIANCGLFKSTFAELKVPALADVDPALMTALDNVAKNGAPAE